MALRIWELFGFPPDDPSAAASAARQSDDCPFVGGKCIKHFRNGLVSGTCTVQPVKSAIPVICCPNRLYAGDYAVLQRIAEEAFGPGLQLVNAASSNRPRNPGVRNVVVFGRRWGKELRLPQREGAGAFFVDWVLALVDATGKLSEFVAAEVQSIDTTGNYRAEWNELMAGRVSVDTSTAGMNWENVSKRILPQLIYKGHVLRRERLCQKGLFFVCPTPVYERIQTRLAHGLQEYPIGQGTLTFIWYSLGAQPAPGQHRPLVADGTFTTTVDQLAVAFTSPRDLPPAGAYERAIRAEL